MLNIVTNPTVLYAIINMQTMTKMQTYSEQSHPNLYNEIIKDHNFRYGKFSPIPYPQINNEEDKSNGTK